MQLNRTAHYESSGMNKNAENISSLAGSPGNLPKRYIDQFEVLLLDMGLTFMFDVDRFNVSDDLTGTYLRLGGNRLSGSDIVARPDFIIADLQDILIDSVY